MTLTLTSTLLVMSMCRTITSALECERRRGVRRWEAPHKVAAWVAQLFLRFMMPPRKVLETPPDVSSFMSPALLVAKEGGVCPLAGTV
jgi:hypothetical protein